jgi:hypothetical protein
MLVTGWAVVAGVGVAVMDGGGQLLQRRRRWSSSPFSLQDFTVLPTEIFRWYVIKISPVIYLPTSSPTEYVCRLSFHR